MKKNLLLEQSLLIADEIDNLCTALSKAKVPSNTVFQLRKSSSSVHANIREANYPQSLPDMLSKLQIAKKECYEAEGWLQMLFDLGHIDEVRYKKHRNSFGRIRRMLIASCKTIECKIE